MTHPSIQRTSESPALVVVGELNADLILSDVNALPAIEAERRAEGMTLTLGSSSAILAANAAALGASVGFVGRVGMDQFGGFVQEALVARSVDLSHVIEGAEPPTGVTVIYTHGTRRGMITYPGAMEALTWTDLPHAYLRRARHLHLSSYYLQRGLRPDVDRLFKEAKAVGLSTSFDTNVDPDERWDRKEVLGVLRHVDVFLPNDAEARCLAGTDVLDDALAVLARPGCAVVVTRGADGVVARVDGRTVRLPAVSVEPVDAVGAGDSFNAGFLTYYLQDRSFEDCLRYGLLAGAFSTRAAGGTAAFDDRDAFRRFVAAHEPDVTATSSI